MPDISIVNSAIASAPKDYLVRGGQELLLFAATANVDGTNAAGTFLPALQMIDPAGNVMWTAVNTSLPVAAGRSANISWFPGSGVGGAATSTPSGVAGVDNITSNAATITVTAPTGPTTNVDLPATGVAAGTYGDTTHVAELTVDAEGRLTSVSSVGISPGGIGGMAQLFDQTLGAPAATIDTGANAIPAGYSSLQISIIARGTAAVFSAGTGIQFNGDTTGANYQYIWTNNSNGTSSSFISTATGNIKAMEGPGASVGAGVFGVAHMTIPGYAQTTAQKAATSIGGFAETGGHSELVHLVGSWSNTAAINQVTLITGATTLAAGSRMTIYGLP